MSLEFLDDQGQHEYRLDGTRVESVTGVLRWHRLVRLDHIPSFVLKGARERGSRVHKLLHYFNEGDLDTGALADPWDLSALDPEIIETIDLGSVEFRDVPYLAAWQRFILQRGFRIDLCEHRIASRRHRCAGTLDCLGELDGEGALVDFKTGSPDDVAAELQTAGYLAFAYEWAETDARLNEVLAQYRTIRRYAVRLRRDGTFRVERYDDARDLQDFLTLVAAYHIAIAHGRPIELDEAAA